MSRLTRRFCYDLSTSPCILEHSSHSAVHEHAYLGLWGLHIFLSGGSLEPIGLSKGLMTSKKFISQFSKVTYQVEIGEIQVSTV